MGGLTVSYLKKNLFIDFIFSNDDNIFFMEWNEMKFKTDCFMFILRNRQIAVKETEHC